MTRSHSADRIVPHRGVGSGDAGTGDQDVDAAERSGGIGGSALHGGGIGDVDSGLVWRVGPGECLGVTVPQADARSFSCQPRSDAGPDAGYAAGDDRHAVGEA